MQLRFFAPILTILLAVHSWSCRSTQGPTESTLLQDENPGSATPNPLCKIEGSLLELADIGKDDKGTPDNEDDDVLKVTINGIDYLFNEDHFSGTDYFFKRKGAKYDELTMDYTRETMKVVGCPESGDTDSNDDAADNGNAANDNPLCKIEGSLLELAEIREDDNGTPDNEDDDVLIVTINKIDYLFNEDHFSGTDYFFKRKGAKYDQLTMDYTRETMEAVGCPEKEKNSKK
jgi:hypothetical protein